MHFGDTAPSAAPGDMWWTGGKLALAIDDGTSAQWVQISAMSDTTVPGPWDFPDAPAVGEQFTPSGSAVSLTWDGNIWTFPAAAGASMITIADAVPTGSPPNTLWWDSDSGELFVNYNDGDSTQFVQINRNAPATTGITDAPLDGQPYNRQSGAWVVDTQTTALDAYTKVESDARFLQLTGGALTGSIDFSTPDQGPAQSVLRGLVGSSLCAEIQYKHEYSTFGQWWFYVGGYWAFHTARGASVPGINVNGDVSAASITDRTVVSNELPPDVIEPFIEGEGEGRGVNLGKLLIHAMCEIAALKERLAKMEAR